MGEYSEYFVLVGPSCRSWVAVVRCADPVAGAVLASITMDTDPTCFCGIKWMSVPPVCIQIEPLELLGWTFRKSCTKPK